MSKKICPTDSLNVRFSQILGAFPSGFGGNFETFLAANLTVLLFLGAATEIVSLSLALIAQVKNDEPFLDFFNTGVAIFVGLSSYTSVAFHVAIVACNSDTAKSLLSSNYRTNKIVKRLTIFSGAILLIGVFLRFTIKSRKGLYLRHCMVSICSMIQFLVAAQYFQQLESRAIAWRFLTSRMRKEKDGTILKKSHTLSLYFSAEMFKIHRFYHRQIFLIGTGMFCELVFNNNLIISYTAKRGVAFGLAHFFITLVKIFTLLLFCAGCEIAVATVS
ncbi:Hypothetical protein NTJ_12930 [Nesidiocoris tenuis]|uniref:Uncharacterized protein n=1 Tax=Nesidiocoris tenuis TaxID=355587 RepID=A0ABN7B763_9HEMI|nr:Hypothetical protein NTJ_12930 [Nesidiocoris tenuis]